MNPTCPACGTALRWIRAAHGWGCDRCRQMVALPAAGAGGRPARVPADDEARPHSQRWLFALIALAIIASLVAAFAR